MEVIKPDLIRAVGKSPPLYSCNFTSSSAKCCCTKRATSLPARVQAQSQTSTILRGKAGHKIDPGRGVAPSRTKDRFPNRMNKPPCEALRGEEYHRRHRQGAKQIPRNITFRRVSTQRALAMTRIISSDTNGYTRKRSRRKHRRISLSLSLR